MPWLAPEQIARLIFNFFHFSKLSLKYRSQSLYKRKELVPEPWHVISHVGLWGSTLI